MIIPCRRGGADDLFSPKLRLSVVPMVRSGLGVDPTDWNSEEDDSARNEAARRVS